NFFDLGEGPAGALANSVLARVVLTRDNASGALVGYVNGSQQFSFMDSSNLGVFDAANNIMRFFQDDSFTGGIEASPGFVDRIAIYDNALSGGQVAALGGPGPLLATPEPGTTLLTALAGAGVGLFAWRRRRTVPRN